MQSADFTWLSDEALVTWLTARDRRPNMMVLTSGAPVEAVAERLTRVCALPVTMNVLPGRLEFPQNRRGTMVLQNVSSLSLSQQIALNDWIDEGRGRTQIISITKTNLWPLVLSGEFLEGLFYRLNVTCLDATQQTPPRPRPGGHFLGLPRA